MTTIRPEDEPVALKILHTADWHLGRRFPAFDSSDQTKLTRARLAVVDRILGEAEANTVDAVLCAGDLFDSPDPEPQWWQGLLDALKRARPRPVFLLPGNHDPLASGSVYDRQHSFRQGLPEWVHVVDRGDFSWPLNDRAVLYAAPCTSKAGDKDLALGLPAREPSDERIRIGMVHGQTFDMPGYQQNFPVSRDAAVQRGFDYLAIGDTHAFRDLEPDATAPTVYPGTPEQMKFDEKATGCVALVVFRRRGCRPTIDPRRVAHWSWRSETCQDIDALRRLHHSNGLDSTVLHLTLDLTVSLAEYDELEKMLTELKGSDAAHPRVGVLQLDRRRVDISTDATEPFTDELPEVLQQVVQRLTQLEQTEVTKRALYQLYKLVRSHR